MATLSSRAIELRNKKGWTVREVARFVECTPGTITHIEKGRVTDPRSQLLDRLARCYGVSKGYLLGGEE